VLPSGVELRIGLAALMGLTDEPGEIAGKGPLIAPVARAIALAKRRAQWRFAILDEHGHLLHQGTTRHRPLDYPTTGAHPGGIVELHVPTYLLDPALAEEHPAWAALLSDLAKQYAKRAPIAQDPTARYPGQPLRRRVEIKQRSCLFPGCPRPATDSQLDHRRDHARGGPTLEANLGALCDKHHDLKTRWAWRLIKRDDQTYGWISALGRRHQITIDPIAPPLPPPIPAAANDADPPF
jgi:hypothetical protein